MNDYCRPASVCGLNFWRHKTNQRCPPKSVLLRLCLSAAALVVDVGSGPALVVEEVYSVAVLEV